MTTILFLIIFIYPDILYAIVAWGSKTNLHKIQLKQNHVIRLIFFATLPAKIPIDPFHVYVNEVELEDKTITRSDV